MPLPRKPFTRIPKSATRRRLEVRQLAERLATMQPGERVSYTDLSALIGGDIQAQSWLLRTARDLVLKTHGFLFDVILNEGVIRLHNQEVLSYEEKRLGYLHNAAGRRNVELDLGVHWEELSPLDQHRWLAQKTIVGAVGLFTHPKTQRQLEAGQPPPQITFDPSFYRDLFGARTPARQEAGGHAAR